MYYAAGESSEILLSKERTTPQAQTTVGDVTLCNVQCIMHKDITHVSVIILLCLHATCVSTSCTHNM